MRKNQHEPKKMRVKAALLLHTLLVALEIIALMCFLLSALYLWLRHIAGRKA